VENLGVSEEKRGLLAVTTTPFKWELNLATIVHTMILLATIGALYGSFQAKFEEYSKSVNDVRGQTSRIEHYLSSQDRDYWRKVAQNCDGDR
jgi:hypothetical protein